MIIITISTMKKVAIIINIILIQSIIIAINAASLHTTDTNNNKSKHTKQYYKRRSYQWNANLNQPTGIATSFEQSIFHKHQMPPNCYVENNDGFSNVLHRSTTKKKQQIKHIVQFSVYILCTSNSHLCVLTSSGGSIFRFRSSGI